MVSWIKLFHFKIGQNNNKRMKLNDKSKLGLINGKAILVLNSIEQERNMKKRLEIMFSILLRQMVFQTQIGCQNKIRLSQKLKLLISNIGSVNVSIWYQMAENIKRSIIDMNKNMLNFSCNLKTNSLKLLLLKILETHS